MSANGMIGIIDYGMGNLRSVSKAVEYLGGKVYVGSDPKKLARSHKLILPGVGAFGVAMRELRKRGLIDVILDANRSHKLILGVCLGLQLFFERSEESPGVKGLGIWKGSVTRFRAAQNKQLKIPHMGWNQVEFKKSSPLTSGVKDQSHFYFVHSYYAKPNDKRLVIGTTEYGVSFPSVLASETVFAVQFHPEKSQRFGLRLLRNFIRLPSC